MLMKAVFNLWFSIIFRNMNDAKGDYDGEMVTRLSTLPRCLTGEKKN